MGKILGIFWKFFFEILENFFEICTTVYKAGLSKVGDLYNQVTKNVTNYPVLATLKILQNCKKISNFWKNFEEWSDEKFFQKNRRCFFCNFENF